MQNTFVDALLVPAFISTIKKIQHESAESLIQLSHYYKRNVGRPEHTAFTEDELLALDKVVDAVLSQSLNAGIQFVLTHSAYTVGGIAGGQLAQVAFSANQMSAPGKQSFRPGEGVIVSTGINGHMILKSLSDRNRHILAMKIGAFACKTQYSDENVPVAISAEREKMRLESRKVNGIKFKVKTIKVS